MATLREVAVRAGVSVATASRVVSGGARVRPEAATLGVRVPDELSVVGFDGIDAADWTQPRLTAIEQPIEEIAETAVGALRTLIDEPERELPQFVFRPRLRLGASSAPPPG